MPNIFYNLCSNFINIALLKQPHQVFKVAENGAMNQPATEKQNQHNEKHAEITNIYILPFIQKFKIAYLLLSLPHLR